MNETIAFLLFISALSVAFDIYIIRKKGKSESISAHFIRFWYKNKKGVFWGLIVGILIGHFAWSMKTSDVYKNYECKIIEGKE